MAQAATQNLPAQNERRSPTLRQSIERMGPEFKKALPGHISADRFVRTAQTAIALTRNIEKVKDHQSLLAACSKAAADGLILDGREAALVVDFKGEVQYRPMVRGLLKLAYNSGQIKSLAVELVCMNDLFDYSPTRSDEPIIHKIDLRSERGAVFAAYGLATLKDGGIISEVMTIKAIHAIRDRSDAWKAFKKGLIKSTPWESDEDEMARKTVFRRLSKYLPASSERDRFQQAVERIDEDYDFDATSGGETVPAQPQAQAKKRGGAAALLKDVTPKEAAPQARQEPDDDYPDHDPRTGEILDNDPGQQDQDDI